MTNSCDKKVSCFSLIYENKYLVIGFSVIIISLSFLMTKTHPKKVSKAKEYGRLYRNLSAIQNGSDLKPKRLEEHLLEFPSLCPIFDSFLSDYYIKNNDFDSWSKTYKKMTNRFFLFNPSIETFSKASAFFEFKLNKQAMEQCSILKSDYDKKNSLLSLYNLYRMKQSYQKLEKPDLEKDCQDLLCLKVDEIKGSELEDSYLYKKIAEIITTHSKE